MKFKYTYVGIKRSLKYYDYDLYTHLNTSYVDIKHAEEPLGELP